MKILQINKFFYPKGGTESYFFDLCRLLENQGHQVIHFSMKHPSNLPSPYEQYFVDEIDLHRASINPLKLEQIIYSRQSKENLEQLIKKEKPDIAHIHNISRQITPSILDVLKKYHIPVVGTLHDYQLICPNYKLFTKGSPCERCNVHKYYQAALNKCVDKSFFKGAIAGLELTAHSLMKIYDQVDRFISPSQFLRNKLISWGRDPAKIICLPHFVDTKQIKPAGPPVNGVTGEGVVFVGRLAEEKGIMTLLQAAARLPGFGFKIVGDGPQRAQLTKFIEANKLLNIELIGEKSRQETLQLVAASRLVVLPSIWYENYSITLLEAAALAKPVIASNIGGNPEIVKDGQTGLLFEPGNAHELAEKINRFYHDPESVRQMGQKAREKVEFGNSPEQHYQKLMGIYQSVT